MTVERDRGTLTADEARGMDRQLDYVSGFALYAFRSALCLTPPATAQYSIKPHT